MKKLLLGLFILGSLSAFGGQYMDGQYRGLYISKQDVEVEVQFSLKDDVITKSTYRRLFFKVNDYLKNDNQEYVQKGQGYLKLLDRITGKKIQEVMPTMYNEKEIEAGGATVREMKVRSALQYGLNLGPFKLTETSHKH